MINLYTDICIMLTEESTGLKTGIWYPVIGTYHRNYTKNEKTTEQDFFCIINEDGKMLNVFPSKCKISRAVDMIYRK